ncbi:MAG: AAA family ATPase, partial [Chitinophagales bacterium]
QVMPQFGNFDLQPSKLNKHYIILNYREPHSDYLFGAHQISDGSLRFMCLATLLLQPPETLPAVVILDEPELGLHPAAISILAGMIHTASQNCQVILATQSTRLVDEFDASNIVIVERNEQENCSEFKTLDEDKLKEWLERYSLSELWEKNVLGGRP